MSEDRSGWNTKWVQGLSDLLLNPKLLKEFLSRLRAAPVKKCDALVGCDNTAEFWVDFHGCYSCCICDEHLKVWVFEVNNAIGQGGAFCDECRIVFSLLPRVMSWRLI